jgi:hypothetical protein
VVSWPLLAHGVLFSSTLFRNALRGMNNTIPDAQYAPRNAEYEHPYYFRVRLLHNSQFETASFVFCLWGPYPILPPPASRTTFEYACLCFTDNLRTDSRMS